MRFTRSLTTYADRRLRIPVQKSDLVVDIGGGDQPHWRADVIVDKFPEGERASQRFLGGSMSPDRPIFVVDAGDLPFRTGTFDYAVCSHTLEHVPDPKAAVEEMCRVAKRGYIEVPDCSMAKIHDFPTHLWWCSLEDGVLVFRAKTRRDFDLDIARLMSDPSLGSGIRRLARQNFDRCIIVLRWEGTVEVRVEGKPDLELALSPPGFGGVGVGLGSKISRPLLQKFASRAWKSRRARQPITLRDLVESDDFGNLDSALQQGILRKRDVAL